MPDNTYYGAGTYGQQVYGVYEVSPDPAGDTDTINDPTLAPGVYPIRYNGLEGQTPGTAATPANSGASGSPFQTVQVSASGSITYVADPAGSGTTVLQVYGGGTSAGTFSTVIWPTVGGKGTHSSFRVRVTASGEYLHLASFTVGVGFFVGISAAGYVAISQQNTTVLVTGTTALSINTWYDMRVDAVAGTGCTVRVYDSGGTLLDTVTYSGTYVPSTSNAGIQYYGYTRGARTQFFDDIRYTGSDAQTNLGQVAPETVTDDATVGEPATAWTVAATTDPVTDPETVTGLSNSAAYIDAPAVADAETITVPSVAWAITTAPDPLADPDAIGQPVLGLDTTNTLYGSGDYGSGLYVGGNPNTVTPAPVVDAEQIGVGEVNFGTDTSNYNYGDGAYGKGPYFGGTGGIQLPSNLYYGRGVYNLGPYSGIDAPGPDPKPLFPNADESARTPLHVLGLGPRSPFALWRGAPNYGVPKGKYDSAPAMILPNAQSKGFTLRLDDGSEARADFTFAPSTSVIPEEMVTDLWWRRKDGRTGTVDMIGRFNASNVTVSRDDTGLRVSCQFESYRQILGAKLVLDYKDRTNAESMWPKGTLITDILKFALPKNTRMNLDAAVSDQPYPLGVTTQPFHLPPGTLISDLMTNLVAISPKPWEWWVETPDALGSAPTLKFIVGQRGTNRDVVLFDAGPGGTNLASWTMNAIADTYANALYFTGRDGGIYDVIPEQIAQYGERDAQDGNSSVASGAQAEILAAAAEKRLRELADHRPTFSVVLKPGFWQGRTHIDVGDTVTLRIVLGAELHAYTYRVSEISAEVDGNGNETVSLTLGTPLASKDPRSKRSPLVRIIRKLKNYTAPPGS